MRNYSLLSIAVLIAPLFLLTSVSAQYRVHSWESFEDGVLPETLIRKHYADEDTVKAVNLWTLGLPQQTMTGIAPVELGRYGMAFKPIEKKMHLSISSPVSLDRRNLGQSGSALFQADFYLPPPGVNYPNTALLAQQFHDENGKPDNYRFYRFGISDGGEKIYFSSMAKKGPPDPYMSKKLEDMELSRPGWHRFQIIFTGQSQIQCAIDGKFIFKAIQEPTLKELYAGVMVASKKFDSYALTDNLSIQWTTKDAEQLPESPWTKEFLDISRQNRSALEPGSSYPWLEDPAQAFQQSNRQNRPLLAMFYIPRTRPYQFLDSIIPMNDDSQQLFNGYVLTRIDANQLNGGMLAEKFDIKRVPTFLVMAPNGQVAKKLMVTQNTTWDTLKSDLSLSGPTTAAP